MVRNNLNDDAFSYVFMWHSLSDACPKCRRLNGREWREQDLFEEVLWDVWEGDIWDLNADHSKAHGEHQYNCRCQLEVRTEFDWSKIRELGELANTLADGGYRIPETISEMREQIKNLKTELEELKATTSEAIRLTSGGLALMRRLTGDENAKDAIMTMQRVTHTAILMRTTMLAAQTALAGAGPLGWLILGISTFGVMLTVADTVEYEMRKYKA